MKNKANYSETKQMNLHEYEIMYNVEATHWWYVGLRELLTYWIKTLGVKKLLDAGCGTGMNMLTMHNLGHDIEGFDYNPTAIDFCRKRNLDKASIGMLQQLNYPDKTFDCIYAMDVIYMLNENDISKFLTQARKCLKENGYLIINTATYQWLYSKHDVATNTYKRYSKSEVLDFLQKANFKVIKATHRVTVLFPLVALAKLVEKLQIFNTRESNENVRGDLEANSSLVNKILTPIMRIENKVLEYLTLPFGSSVFTVAQAPKFKVEK